MSREIGPVRIGNCSGFYGDRHSAMREMLAGGELDYVTGDYLAELTMLILARDRAKSPDRGYAKTFLTQLEECLGTALDKGTKIVANAGGLSPTFQDVAGGDRTCELVVAGAAPSVVRGCGADDHRSVGDAAGDDDIRARVQAVDDAPGSEVGVGGQWRCGSEPQLLGSWQQVVALDMGHAHAQPETVCKLTHRLRQAGGVESACVGDDAHAAVQCEA